MSYTKATVAWHLHQLIEQIALSRTVLSYCSHYYDGACQSPQPSQSMILQRQSMAFRVRKQQRSSTITIHGVRRRLMTRRGVWRPGMRRAMHACQDKRDGDVEAAHTPCVAAHL